MTEGFESVAKALEQFQPDQIVTVTQQIPQQAEAWCIRISGTVVRFEQQKTGAWFAHAKDGKLWLDRLTVRKDDGEIVVFILDSFTHVEVHDKPSPPDEPMDMSESYSEEDETNVAESKTIDS